MLVYSLSNTNSKIFFLCLEIIQQYSLVAIFSEGHGGIPCPTAQSCAPRPTKKLQKDSTINKREVLTFRSLIMRLDSHQGGILPAESFPFCASVKRQLATKTGFFIPEKKKTNEVFHLSRALQCNEFIELHALQTHLNPFSLPRVC